MLKLLRNAQADGVIIHKIDRSARNLKDWADLGDLIDQGIVVQFVNESLDLNSRGGRLSADIQAVVAADYVRNLREETRKGFYGRLKQGLYPLPAPLGYLDMGKGKPKELDPARAPLIRRAFELYANGRYGLRNVADEMFQLGLRTRRGGKVTVNALSIIFNNPFYIGLIRLRKTNETYSGIHEPLITKSLFDRVHGILTGKTNARTIKHDFLYRRLLLCKHCGYSLIAELQKGRVYYRCHIKSCPKTCIREDFVDTEVSGLISPLQFSDMEKQYLEQKIANLRERWVIEKEAEINSLSLRVTQLQDRLARLTDAYIDRLIDKDIFEQRKAALLLEHKDAEEKITQLKEGARSVPDQLADFLELAGSVTLSHEMGFPEEKRDLLRKVTSNRQVDGKELYITLANPFSDVANRFQNSNGAPYRVRPRTKKEIQKVCNRLFRKLVKYFKAKEAAAINGS